LLWGGMGVGCCLVREDDAETVYLARDDISVWRAKEDQGSEMYNRRRGVASCGAQEIRRVGSDCETLLKALAREGEFRLIWIQHCGSLGYGIEYTIGLLQPLDYFALLLNDGVCEVTGRIVSDVRI
jgi:hypothetical protein